MERLPQMALHVTLDLAGAVDVTAGGAERADLHLGETRKVGLGAVADRDAGQAVIGRDRARIVLEI